MDKVFVGKIVNTHGIKGEVRIISDFERKSDAFSPGNFIYIKDKSYEIASYRVHKSFDMITLVGFNNINDVLPFKGLNVFIDRNSLNLSGDEYILSDLIGLKVMLNNKEIGIVIDYSTGVNTIVEVKRDNYTFYIPIKGSFIDKVDINNGIIMVNEEVKELML